MSTTEPAIDLRPSASDTIAHTVTAMLAIGDWDQADLAAYMSVSESTVSKMLGGKRRILADDVAAFSRFFDRPVQEFYDGIDHKLGIRTRSFLTLLDGGATGVGDDEQPALPFLHPVE